MVFHVNHKFGHLRERESPLSSIKLARLCRACSCSELICSQPLSALNLSGAALRLRWHMSLTLSHGQASAAVGSLRQVAIYLGNVAGSASKGSCEGLPGQTGKLGKGD